MSSPHTGSPANDVAVIPSGVREDAAARSSRLSPAAPPITNSAPAPVPANEPVFKPLSSCSAFALCVTRLSVWLCGEPCRKKRLYFPSTRLVDQLEPTTGHLCRVWPLASRNLVRLGNGRLSCCFKVGMFPVAVSLDGGSGLPCLVLFSWSETALLHARFRATRRKYRPLSAFARAASSQTKVTTPGEASLSRSSVDRKMFNSGGHQARLAQKRTDGFPSSSREKELEKKQHAMATWDAADPRWKVKDMGDAGKNVNSW